MGRRAPQVTGISPSEGPPGTIVKIRGENLGTSAKDVIKIEIGKRNCTFTAEWQHSRLIHARTSNHQGMGDIIITTKSGGIGTSFVNFRGYSPRVGLLTESAVWVDESKLFEDKPTSTLSNSRMYSPNSTTYTDPLGVAPEETGAVLDPKLIEEWYKGYSSNPLSVDFDPSRFLLERHLDTGFSALKSGYYHLQSQDTRTSVGPTSFVRGHLTTILDALTTLNDIQKLLMQHESESVGGDICEEMQGILKSCNYASISLFKDILTRKDDSDAKRNVLNVLHRYRFLFNLPRSIEKNIQQGEYEILISDYNRAKSLFLNTEVKSFQKALTEVDQKITVFSEQLKMKLFDFPTPLEEQKKFIRYLNELDYAGNSGWECITKQSQWIRAMLVDCQVRYKSDESIEDMRSSAVKGKVDYKSGHKKSVVMPVSSALLMVEELCKLISEHLTELWNLGQTYLSNQLGDKRNSLKETDNPREEFLEIVKEVIRVYCEITDCVLHPFEKKQLGVQDTAKLNALVQWLPDGVNAVRSTLEKMNNLGLTEDVIMPLKTLTIDSVADCVHKVLSASVSEIQKLSQEESWELNRREELYSTSELPYKFETVFINSLKFVRDFMKESKTESKSVQSKDVVPLLKKMFDEFICALQTTVYSGSNAEVCMIDGSNSGQIMSKDLQVLVVLSNCYHVKTVIVPRIMTQCVKFGFEELKEFQTEMESTIDKLDERVFMTYIEMKGEPLIGAIEVGINLGEYRWDTTQSSNNVRQYIQDILMKLISTHDQISSVSTLFINRIFTLLVELISDELLRIYACIDTYSHYGGVQAAIELRVLRTSLENYMSEKAQMNFRKTIDQIPSLDGAGESKMKETVESFKSSMWYQLSSFSIGEDDISHTSQDNKSVGLDEINVTF